jgi:hypothetical protein
MVSRAQKKIIKKKKTKGEEKEKRAYSVLGSSKKTY